MKQVIQEQKTSPINNMDHTIQHKLETVYYEHIFNISETFLNFLTPMKG